MRKKRFNLCAEFMCMRTTMSGVAERDPAKRWCHYHLPKNRQANGDQLKNAARKICSATNRYRRLFCEPRRVARKARFRSPPRLRTDGVRCTDPIRRFKRVRCLTRLPIEKAA